MPSSLRLPLVLGIGLLIGIGGVAWSLIDSTPAFSIGSPVLHSPPSGYQPIGPCEPGLGVPYQHTERQIEAPLLFYYGDELTMLVHILKERDIQDGLVWTLPNELANIPVVYVSFTFSPDSGHLADLIQEPHYQFWMHVQHGLEETPLLC